MIAFVTSIGETTTELCKWSLERQGFRVEVIQDNYSLWDKLRRISISVEEDYVRVDADVIVNRNIKELIRQDKVWWYQSLTYDWFAQDTTHGGVQFIRKQAIPIIRKHIKEAEHKERPESYLYRLEEFHNPRRCGTFEKICGLHGFKQYDVERVRVTKARRGQLANYDFELAERLSEL